MSRCPVRLYLMIGKLKQIFPGGISIIIQEEEGDDEEENEEKMRVSMI